MPVTKHGRRTAYDNIAAGSVAGFERTFTDTVTRNERYGGGFYTSTSTGDEGSPEHSNVAAGASVTDDNLGPENRVVGAALGEENVG